MESKDLARLSSYYSDDISLIFANAAAVRGKDLVLEQMATMLSKVESVSHPLKNAWQEDGGVVIFEVTTVWHLLDGSEKRIDACSIFTIRDDRFIDQRIYVDNAPVGSVLG